MATFRNLLVRLGIDFSEKGLKKAERAIGRFEKRLVRVSGIAAKGAGVASLAGGATALSAALVPAMAAMVAMPAALGAVKLATGVAKVGFAGMGDAMSAVAEGDAKALNEALKKLSPNARAVVRETGKINFKSIRSAVQDRMFDGLAKQIGPVSRNLLPSVRKGMVGVAGSFNTGAKEAAAFARTPVAKGAVNKIFGATKRVMDNLTTAVQPALKGITSLTVNSLPLAERMTSWAVGGIKATGAFLSSKAGAEKLSGWARKAGDTLAQMGRIGGNAVRFLAGIFKSTKGSGDGVLDTIEKITARMATFSASVGGQQRMTEAFRLLLDILHAVVGVLPIFIGPLGAVLKIMTSLPEPVRGAGVQLLAFSVVAVALGGKLSFLFRTITSVSGAAITAGGAAVKFGSGLLRGGAALGENAGAAARAGAAVRSFGSAAIEGTRIMGQFIIDTGQLVLAKGRLALATAGAATKQGILTAAQWAANAASKALAAGTWLVNAALRANPIGIVITLLVAIGAALVLAYKKSATFRAIVDGALRAVGRAGSWLWNNTLGPALRAIRDFLVGTLAPKFLWLYNTIIAPTARKIGQVISFAVNNVIKPVFSFLAKTVTQTIPNAFKSGVAAIGRFWGKVQEIAKKPVSFLVNTIYNGGIRKIWNWVAEKVGLGILPEIKGFARGGILPGYSRRDDQLIMARSGEGIIVPEAVKSLGERFIHRANALKGNAAKLLGGFGDPGGLGIPSFEQGGIVGWVSGFIKKGKDFFMAGFRKAAEAALNPIVNLARTSMGGTGFGSLLAGAVNKIVSGVLDTFRPLESELAGGPGRKAVAAARGVIGTPYSWGGGGPGGPSYGIQQGAGIRGFDCSSLMQYAWHKATGRVSPRTTYTQMPWVKRISGNPPPGAFGFPHSGHVFMATGNGRTLVEAPYTGARVRETGMRSAWWGMPPWKFDDGGVLPPGTTPVYNGTRRPEYVFTDRQMRSIGGNHYTIILQATPGVNKAEIGREIVGAIKEFERGNGKSWRKP